MPRGINGHTGLPNCLVKRHVCPECKRKGLYETWFQRRGVGSDKFWLCMYQNCPSRNGGKMFKSDSDLTLINANK